MTEYSTWFRKTSHLLTLAGKLIGDTFMEASKTPFVTGVAILLAGVLIVVSGAFLAFEAYLNYRPLLPAGGDLQTSITNTVYELLNLVIKLGFLGAMIWAGSILLGKGVDLFKALYVKEKKPKESEETKK